MKIFLSAVSGEFRTFRESLASSLRSVEFITEEQKDFRQHDTTLLKKLENKVAACDCVIALIGDLYGFEPPVESLPKGTPRRSYTQWEYRFALGERLSGSEAQPKRVLAYFTEIPTLSSKKPTKRNSSKTSTRW